MTTRPNKKNPATLRTVIGITVRLVLCAKWSIPDALPVGGTTVAGHGQIAESGNVLTVEQSSPRLAIDWQSFDIGAGQSVIFRQPSAQSIALNRVLSQDPTVILGNLSANGQVFVLNPNGVLFGRGAQVNVGGLLASTLQMSVADFLAGQYTLSGNDNPTSVVNQGTLRAHDGGYIALLAPQVVNEGVITARLGTAVVGAGKQVSLTIDGGHLLSFNVDRAAVDAFVSNKQLIEADGGTVILSVRAKDALLSTVINNQGIVEARGVSSKDGVILLDGGTAGVVSSSGTLDASGHSEDELGGRIEITGDKVGLFGNAVVNASGSAGGGTVLIGGDTRGRSPNIHNAQAAYVAPGATIDADALNTGNGGKVVVWSDDLTRFAGTVSARGGPNGGNGGSVETSGKIYLDATGSVNASAPAGHPGEWLLDPYDVTLSSAATSNGAFAAGVFTPTGNSSVASTTTIQTSLNSGTSVTINTSGAGTEAGNITVANAISKTAGGAATLTLNATNQITFNTGANLTSTTGALNVALNAGAGGISNLRNVNTNGGSLTFNSSGSATQAAGSVISGSGTLVMQNSGTLTLSGANTYTGATTISAGTLLASSATALGTTAGGVVVSNGATLNINNVAIGAEALTLNGSGVGGNGALTGTGTASLSGNVALASASSIGTPNAGDALTLSGVISGANALTKLGAGTLTLSGANTYSGQTSVNAGTLRLGAANRIAATSDITVASGAVLNLNNFAETAGSIAGAGTITLGTATLTAGGDNASTTFSGVVSGTGGFTKAGTGTTTVSGVNTYTGTTTISGGTLSLAGGSAIADISAVSLANTAGVSLALNGTNETIGSLAGGGTTGGNVALGTGTLTTGGNNTATTYSGVLSGTGGLTKVGTGVMTLSGVNTYSGPTSVKAGTLLLGAANRIAATSDITVATGATFNLNNFAETAGSVAGAGTLALGSGALAAGGDNASTTYSGVISGTGSISKQGTGTFTLSGANTYTGATTASAGILVASSATALGTTAGGVVVSNGATLNINNVAIGAEVLTLNGTGVGGNGALTGTGTASLSGNVTLASASSISSPNSTDTLTLTGVISGANALTKLGAGTLSLAGANTYSGQTSVNAGTLRLGAANRIASTSDITVVSGAVLNLNNFAETAGSIAGAGNITLGTATLTAGGDNASTTFSGVLSGTGGFTKTGTGTTTLSGANTYTGATTISAGTLGLLGGSAIADTSAVILANTASASLALNGTDETIGSLAGGGTAGGNVALGAGILTAGGNNTATTYTGVISGTGGLTKVGTGAMTLSGANIYSGPTSVSRGALLLGAANRIAATSDIRVATGATLNLNNFAETAGSIGGTGTLALGSGALAAGANNASTTYSGIISGTGSITKQGTGALTLSGANTYTGLTTVSAGTLVASSATALGTTAGGVVVSSGATLNINNVAIGAEALTLNGPGVGGNGALIGTGTASLAGNATLATSSSIGTPNTGDALTLSGVISGANALTKLGAGTLTLSGANTYTGATNINAGTLQLGAANRIAATSNITVASGAVFNLNNFNETAASIAGAGNISLGTATLTAGGGNASTTFSGVLSGIGGFTKTGTGTTTLSGVNIYTGATSINGGTLSLQGGSAIADVSAVTLANTAGVFLALNGTDETIGSLAGGGARGGNVALGAATLRIGAANTSTTYSGVIGGTGGITKLGTGTLMLAGANAYSGDTTVSAGILRYTGNNGIGNASAVTVMTGASLDLAGTDETAGSLAGAGNVTLGAGTLTVGANNTSTEYSGVISGTGGLTKSGTAALTLSGGNAYSGATTINGGTLVASNPTALGSSTAGATVADGATLQVADVALNAGPIKLSGNGVAGIGALTGTGTASLAGPVSLAADTRISAGPGASLTLNSTLDGPVALDISGGGTVSLGGHVGGTTALASLTSDSTTALTINGGLLVTSGAQTYNGHTTLGMSTTLRTVGGSNIVANGAVTETAGTLSLDTGSGNATLTNVSNDIAAVAVTSGNAVSLVNANALTVGGSNLRTLQAQTLSGNLTLTGAIVASGSGDAIVLAAAGNFNNTGGSLVSGSGRWRVYSTDPASNSLGGLASDFKRYNCTFTGGCLTQGTTVPLSGNGFLYSLAPTLTIGANGVVSIYGAPASALTYSATGFVDGDTSATALLGALTRETGNLSGSGHEAAGIYSIDQGSVASSLGYHLAFTGASYTINPRPLTVTATVPNKVYDGTLTASATLSGDQISGDALTTSFASVALPDANAGTGKTINVTGISLHGADAGDYSLPSTSVTTTAAITAKPVVVWASNQTKVYGSSDPALTYGINATGLVGSDLLSGTLARQPGETVAAGPYEITQGSLSNPNYSITFNNAALAITPATLTYVADPVSTFQWSPLPRFGGTVTGFVAGDTLASATTGMPTFSPGISNSHIAGVFASTGSGLTANSGDYVFVQAASNATAFVVVPDSETRVPGTPPEAYSGALTSSTQIEGPCRQAQGAGDSSHCEMTRHRTGSMEQLPFVVVSSGLRLPAGLTPY